MINLHDVKVGDTVLVEFEGKKTEGSVLGVDHENKQVHVQTDEQDFWYEQEAVFPILLDEAQLLKLKFRKDETLSGNGNGQVFVRGPFSVRLFKLDGQDAVRLDYRDEHREIKGPLTVNELQNHYHGMTNFHLE